MAATLLALSSGHYSLEFGPDDLDAVRLAIRALYGRPESDGNPFITTLRFGGASFAYQNEWDDPCIVSGSSEGDAILKGLHAHLAESEGA